MALHSLYCADVPLRNCSLTHSPRDPAATRHAATYRHRIRLNLSAEKLSFRLISSSAAPAVCCPQINTLLANDNGQRNKSAMYCPATWSTILPSVVAPPCLKVRRVLYSNSQRGTKVTWPVA